MKKNLYHFLISKRALLFKVSTNLKNVWVAPLDKNAREIYYTMAQTQAALGNAFLLNNRLSNPYTCLMQFYINNNWLIQDVEEE